jgi:hypothetical protein
MEARSSTAIPAEPNHFRLDLIGPSHDTCCKSTRNPTLFAHQSGQFGLHAGQRRYLPQPTARSDAECSRPTIPLRWGLAHPFARRRIYIEGCPILPPGFGGGWGFPGKRGQPELRDFLPGATGWDCDVRREPRLRSLAKRQVARPKISIEGGPSKPDFGLGGDVARHGPCTQYLTAYSVGGIPSHGAAEDGVALRATPSAQLPSQPETLRSSNLQKSSDLTPTETHEVC